MIEIDIKKVFITPKTAFNAIDLLIRAEQNHLDAINILVSILEFNTEEYWEIQKPKIEKYLSKFTKLEK